MEIHKWVTKRCECGAVKRFYTTCGRWECSNPACRKAKLARALYRAARVAWEPERKIVMITLAYKNRKPEDMDEQFRKRMNSNLKGFLRFIGAACWVAVKENKVERDGMIHPHWHVLAQFPYVDHYLAVGEWGRLTGDSYSVWFSSHEHATLGDALKYALKYAFKNTHQFFLRTPCGKCDVVTRARACGSLDYSILDTRLGEYILDTPFGVFCHKLGVLPPIAENVDEPDVDESGQFHYRVEFQAFIRVSRMRIRVERTCPFCGRPENNG